MKFSLKKLLLLMSWKVVNVNVIHSEIVEIVVSIHSTHHLTRKRMRLILMVV